jgi:hypothetical protein
MASRDSLLYLRFVPGHSVLSALLLPVVANAADAQTYTCQSANSDHALALKNDVIALVTGTDTRAVAARDTLKLLPASASQVSIVTHTETCATAGRASSALQTIATSSRIRLNDSASSAW